jgi:hypothetical protein
MYTWEYIRPPKKKEKKHVLLSLSYWLYIWFDDSVNAHEFHFFVCDGWIPQILQCMSETLHDGLWNIDDRVLPCLVLSHVLYEVYDLSASVPFVDDIDDDIDLMKWRR